MAIKQGNKRLTVTFDVEHIEYLNKLKAEYGLSTTEVLKKCLKSTYVTSKVGTLPMMKKSK